MKSIEIESWALRILSRVESGLPAEDAKVELKRDWLEPVKAARRLAGHANAACGEEILWLIGVDEKARSVVGTPTQDIATWLAQVRACFDGVTPSVRDLVVSYHERAVVALCFDTCRAPFVVKNPRGGEIQFEVPWRDGTAVRSATRNDLILLLAPMIKFPKMEILSGQIDWRDTQSGRPASSLSVSLQLYVVPMDGVPITFPAHLRYATLTSEGQVIAEGFPVKACTPADKARQASAMFRLLHSHGSSRTTPDVDVRVHREAIEVTADEIVISGAGRLEIDAFVEVATVAEWPKLELALTFVEAVNSLRSGLIAIFAKKAGESVWELMKPTR